jgi:hypothetical protein
MRTSSIPQWVWLVVLVVLTVQGATLCLLAAGKLPGAERNVVPQALLGGAVVLLALGTYVLRNYPDACRTPPSWAGPVVMTLVVVIFTGIYFRHALPVLTLRYDLASWSETYFISDIIKWRAGAKLYLPPDWSNSSAYGPAAPALSYFVAWLFHRTTSIVFYRFLQQFYLVLAAVFESAAAWQLIRLADPDRVRKLSRLWLVFFAFASFLLATNRSTNAFNIFLHVDALALLATTLAFWLMTRHAVTQNSRWLWPMAMMPAAAFLVKQYLAIWAAVYVIYLWVEGERGWRRAVGFGVACFGALGLTIGLALVHWGEPFRYWVLQVFAQQVVSFPGLFNMFFVAAWPVLLGVLGGTVLLRGRGSQSMLGMWVGWLVMVLAAAYTAGIAYIPTHQGPATMVGGAFFLAALAILYPVGQTQFGECSGQWLRAGMCCLLVVVVFAGLSYPLEPNTAVPGDFFRYVSDIEQEFQGLPPDRVLTDFGDWAYLRDGVLMKDRAAILPLHRKDHFGMIERLRQKAYAKILVRNLDSANFAYDRGGRTGVRKALLENYRVVRTIPGVRGMEGWLFYQMLLSDVSVLEPKSDTGGKGATHSLQR